MEAMGEDGVDGLPFQLQIFSSEATNCNIPIFCVRAIQNQWLWVF